MSALETRACEEFNTAEKLNVRLRGAQRPLLTEEQFGQSRLRTHEGTDGLTVILEVAGIHTATFLYTSEGYVTPI